MGRVDQAFQIQAVAEGRVVVTHLAPMEVAVGMAVESRCFQVHQKTVAEVEGVVLQLFPVGEEQILQQLVECLLHFQGMILSLEGLALAGSLEAWVYQGKEEVELADLGSEAWDGQGSRLGLGGLESHLDLGAWGDLESHLRWGAWVFLDSLQRMMEAWVCLGIQVAHMRAEILHYQGMELLASVAYW